MSTDRSASILAAPDRVRGDGRTATQGACYGCTDGGHRRHEDRYECVEEGFTGHDGSPEGAVSRQGGRDQGNDEEARCGHGCRSEDHRREDGHQGSDQEGGHAGEEVNPDEGAREDRDEDDGDEGNKEGNGDEGNGEEGNDKNRRPHADHQEDRRREQGRGDEDDGEPAGKEGDREEGDREESGRTPQTGYEGP